MISSPLLASLPDIFHGFGTLKPESLPHNLVTSKQVHGTEILFLDTFRSDVYEGFDILMTDKPGIAVAVKTADCLSLLMVEPQQKIVAAVHAGWKGTLARVTLMAVQEIKKRGGDPCKLAVAMGPSIQRCCCEVEADVALPFQNTFPGVSGMLEKKSDKKWALDIPKVNRFQLIALGVRPERIDGVDLCTYCRPDLFYSYRREGEKAGRMVSFLKLLNP